MRRAKFSARRGTPPAQLRHRRTEIRSRRAEANILLCGGGGVSTTSGTASPWKSTDSITTSASSTPRRGRRSPRSTRRRQAHAQRRLQGHRRRLRSSERRSSLLETRTPSSAPCQGTDTQARRCTAGRGPRDARRAARLAGADVRADHRDDASSQPERNRILDVLQSHRNTEAHERRGTQGADEGGQW
jgi:hypothetical protein